MPALVSVRAENVPGSNWVCRSCRRVTRTTSMGESGHFRSLKPTNSLPQSGRSDDSGPVHLQRLYSSIMATYGMGT
jgi:hypothetical protein